MRVRVHSDRHVASHLPHQDEDTHRLLQSALAEVLHNESKTGALENWHVVSRDDRSRIHDPACKAEAAIEKDLPFYFLFPYFKTASRSAVVSLERASCASFLSRFSRSDFCSALCFARISETLLA